MRPIVLAFNLIHHPDEPDGVRTRDVATTASMTEDYPGDRLSKCLHMQRGYPSTSRRNLPKVAAEIKKSRNALDMVCRLNSVNLLVVALACPSN
jgi:hypothetical protein